MKRLFAWSKSNLNMAKVSVNVFCCVLLCHTAVAITNLTQITGLVINPAIVSEIPACDFSGSEAAYLNFIRALATTNEADLVAGFAPQKIIGYAGSNNPDVLDGRSVSPFF